MHNDDRLPLPLHMTNPRRDLYSRPPRVAMRSQVNETYHKMPFFPSFLHWRRFQTFDTQVTGTNDNVSGSCRASSLFSDMASLYMNSDASGIEPQQPVAVLQCHMYSPIRPVFCFIRHRVQGALGPHQSQPWTYLYKHFKMKKSTLPVRPIFPSSTFPLLLIT